MAIVAYCGLPRSGKSYGVVENVIVPSLEKGRTIVTNIPIKKGYLLDDFPKGRIVTFTNKEALDCVKQGEVFFTEDRFPQGSIFVIDECWRFWSSGTKANNIPEAEKAFFTEHGHNVGDQGFTSEIVLVTQGLNQVCAFVRDLIEETFIAKKLNALGMNNSYQVTCYERAAVGQKPNNTVIRTMQGTYKPEIYKYYQSHTKNKTDFAAGMEEKADDRGNAWKDPKVKYGFPIGIFILLYSFYSAYSWYTGRTGSSEQKTPVEQTSTKPGQFVKTVIESKSETKLSYQSKYEIERNWLETSDKYRLVGQINDLYLIWSDSGTRTIHNRQCSKSRNTGEPFCVIEGQLVTYYSFKEPQRDGSIDRSYGTDIVETLN